MDDFVVCDNPNVVHYTVQSNADLIETAQRVKRTLEVREVLECCQEKEMISTFQHLATMGCNASKTVTAPAHRPTWDTISLMTQVVMDAIMKSISFGGGRMVNVESKLVENWLATFGPPGGL